MNLRIATPHQAARIIINMMKMRKNPSPTNKSMMMMTKSATAPSASREIFDSSVAEMDLSSNEVKPHSKSNIKEHILSSNNLDKALNDAHLLNTL